MTADHLQEWKESIQELGVDLEDVEDPQRELSQYRRWWR